MTTPNVDSLTPEYQHAVQALAETWTITINRYQRDNLLWLLQACGYGASAIEPFHLANTGDWIGEIHNMLGTERWSDGQRMVEYDPRRPNKSRSDLHADVVQWVGTTGSSTGGVQDNRDDTVSEC